MTDEGQNRPIFSAKLEPSSTAKFIAVNPLKGRGINWLHLAIQVQPTFLISDIQALWRSALSARVPECQKLKM